MSVLISCDRAQTTAIVPVDSCGRILLEGKETTILDLLLKGFQVQILW